MKKLQITRHLQSEGYHLIRQKTHKIYYNAELNERIVTSKTPSDRCSYKNIIQQIERIKRKHYC